MVGEGADVALAIGMGTFAVAKRGTVPEVDNKGMGDCATVGNLRDVLSTRGGNESDAEASSRGTDAESEDSRSAWLPEASSREAVAVKRAAGAGAESTGWGVVTGAGADSKGR